MLGYIIAYRLPLTMTALLTPFLLTRADVGSALGLAIVIGLSFHDHRRQKS